MIKYNLKCQNEHEFESWFSDSNEFEKLKTKELLECIYCSSRVIKKMIMAPMVFVNKSKKNELTFLDKELLGKKNQLIKLRKYVEKNFEFVGDKLGEKVREAYYDDKNKKNIYGRATQEEKEELAEEGINLLTVPWVDKDN